MSISIRGTDGLDKGARRLQSSCEGREGTVRTVLEQQEFYREGADGEEGAIEALNQAGAMYDSNVEVTISEVGQDVLEKIRRVAGEEMKKFSDRKETEEEKQARIERDMRFQSTIKPAVILHLIIPNFQANDALEKSLTGVSSEIMESVYGPHGILHENLLRRNAAGLTEEQRQGLISYGMEKVRYIAQNFMEEDQAKQFVSVMETLAKYGMNGKMDEDGKVTIDIKWGPPVGVSDDMYYGNEYEILRREDPELSKERDDLWEEIKGTTDRERRAELARKMIQLDKKARLILYTPGVVGKSPVDREKEEYINWKKKMDETKVSDVFSRSDYSSSENFWQSINSQNADRGLLSTEYLEKDFQRFMDILS